MEDIDQKRLELDDDPMQKVILEVGIRFVNFVILAILCLQLDHRVACTSMVVWGTLDLALALVLRRCLLRLLGRLQCSSVYR